MEKQIKLDEKSAQEFVSAASKCKFDIDVFYNRIIIDASDPRTFESGSDKDSDSKVLRRR